MNPVSFVRDHQEVMVANGANLRLKALEDSIDLDWEVVKRKQEQGFKVLPCDGSLRELWRLLTRYKQLTIDYEVLPATSEAFIYTAMVRLMIRRLA